MSVKRIPICLLCTVFFFSQTDLASAEEGTHKEIVDGHSVDVPDGSHIEQGDGGPEIVRDRETPASRPESRAPESSSPPSSEAPAESRTREPRELHGGMERPDTSRGTPGPAPQAGDNHFNSNGFTLSPAVTARLATIANRFAAATGRDLVVTSGSRTANSQARAMYDRFQLGETGGYSNPQANSEILLVYRAGMSAGRSQEQIVADMTNVIQGQMARGILISGHLSDRACDVRSRDLSSDQVRQLMEISRAQGAVPILEGSPPHVHIQFP